MVRIDSAAFRAIVLQFQFGEHVFMKSCATDSAAHDAPTIGWWSKNMTISYLESRYDCHVQASLGPNRTRNKGLD